MLRTHPREAAAIHLAGVEGEFQVLRSPPGDSHAPLGVRLLCRKAGLESLPRSNPLGGWLLHAGPQELMDEGVLSLPRQGSPGKLLRQWMWGPSCVSVRSEPCAPSGCVCTSPAILSSVACLDERCKGHEECVLHGGRARFRLLRRGPGPSGNKEGRLWAGNPL